MGDQKRAILAVILSGIILFGWQYFFAPAVVVNTVETNKTITDTAGVNKTKTEFTNSNPSTINTDITETVDVSTYEVSNAKSKYIFNNYLTIINANFSNTKEDFSTVFKEHNNNNIYFKFNTRFEKVYFVVNKINDNEYELKSKNGALNGKLFIDDKGYLNVNLLSNNIFTYKFELIEKEEELTGGKTKLFSILSDDLDTFNVGDDDKGDTKINWFAMDFNYHLFATVVDKKPMVFKILEEGLFSVKDLNASNSLNYKQIFVKKEYDNLNELGNNLHLSVDFGIWSILAVPILHGLQFFYTLFANYGISIIILTLLMRTITFPLQYKSFKSMKKMQDVQPELTKLREKFKEDPKRMQVETMALFKKAGANPLGGCLPMILQMPIFFAFYRVLYSSVELVDAPFFFWIHDLSEKDPYYVLPVLMAVAMFFHQKLTPSTTADPTQKKIMMFMPLIFAVFMKDFPAGLTLYIFVSTVVAMLQQMFVFKRT